MIGEQQLPYDSCSEWNDRVVAELVDSVRPVLVITSGAHWVKPLGDFGEVLGLEDGRRRLADGLVERWSEIVGAGLEMIVIRDTPYPRFDVPECVVENRASLSACAFGRVAAMGGNWAQVDASERLGVPLIDVTDRICAQTECPAVIDDYLVWRDTHHLTATYSKVLAPIIGPQIRVRVQPSE